MSSGPFPTPGGGFVHPLLRARDWQGRPEFQALCQWWKDGGVGVCALVGIGGAGKTAIVERFLQILPGGYPEHPKVPKDRNLAAPARLLVFSFYDAPNPDTFFAELAAWLEDRLSIPRGEAADGTIRPPSYHQTLDLLGRAGRCLLVLDGLEKVQNDGARGGAFGQILDGRLRDFVVRVADGYLPHLSIVITSRFRLYDPLVGRTWYYRQIGIEKLQPYAAVQLLRDRDVRGTDEQLEDMAREQGFHALSVDLVGGYISRFCGGDPKRFKSLTTEPAEIADPELDPQIAAIREQEHKFARLAEQYHQALAHNDPAVLALLQRVCLFRLGVESKTLTSIFTGEGKESISGPALAGLNEQQIQSRLQLLVEMRLVEAKLQGSAWQDEIYTVHPAVRDGFLRKLDIETVHLGHAAARQGLEASLGGQSGDNPSNPATLDLLEEIVYHTLAAGHAQEAFDIYWYRIGNYQNLLWRLGAYERGERICRAFADQPPHVAPLPAGLTENDQSVFINEWALYLGQLGQLAAAECCFKRHTGLSLQLEKWDDAITGYQNLARILLLAGRLTDGLCVAEEALGLAEQEGEEVQANSFAYRGYVHAMQGGVQSALTDFRTALDLQNKDDNVKPPLYSLRGILYVDSLVRLGRHAQSEILVRRIQEIQEQYWGPHDIYAPSCKLFLALLLCENYNFVDARQLLREAHDWALQRDAREPLCWSALVESKFCFSKFIIEQRSADQQTARESLEHATLSLKEGLRIARGCGFGILHIDLLLIQAQLALHEGRAADAERDVHLALDEGIHPPPESGFPELLAATDPECLYAWGIAEGRHLLAEALLLQAAQKLGQAEFIPKRLDRLPADVRSLIDRAREELNQALELWRKLKDPESGADVNPRGERTKHVLEGLEGGILTEYPLEPLRSAEPAASPATIEPAKRTRPMSRKKHVFLSYCRDNQADVAMLHDELVASGEAVWWDQNILPGQDWRLEIRKAMRDAYAVILCLSEETAGRTTSGIYPEALDAIAAYREYSPGNIFLIPVRLSDCEIPLIEIDATRTLDRLQFVDLFPPAQRAAGLGRLLNALQAAPHHP